MSGTPPRDLLYSDPVSYDRSDPYAQVFEQSRDGPEVKAFHWGSLTSGSRITAFWILLSPFMLANVAGWMAISRPMVHAFIRVAGLGISGLFVAQGMVVMVDLTFQVVRDQPYGKLAVIGGLLSVVAVYVLIVWRLSTRSLLSRLTTGQQLTLLFGRDDESLRPPNMTTEELDLHDDDPAHDAQIADPRLWVRQSVLHRLRRQHLASGLAVAALGVELGLDNVVQSTLAYALLLLVAVDTFVVAFRSPFAAGVRRASAYNVHVAILLLTLAVVDIAVEDLPTAASWPGAHQLVFFVAFVAGIAALGVYVAQAAERETFLDLTAFLPLSALAIALLIGGALGVATAVVAELLISRFLPHLSSGFETFDLAATEVMTNGGAWTTVAMLCFVMALVAIAGFAAWRGRPALPSERGRTWAVMRRVTRRAPYVFGGAGAVAASFAVLATATLAAVGWDLARLEVEMTPPILEWVAAVIYVAMIVGLTGAIFHISKPWSFFLPILGAIVLWTVWYVPLNDRALTIPLLEMPVHPTQLLDVSFLVIVLALSYLILRSILGGFGDPEKRRKVGMLWDTGSFWPRWFHPLAPPAYGPHAVRSLARALDSEAPQVLAAHSQGSVISTVTLATQDCTRPAGLVTYGSPLGILYAKLFPAVGIEEMLETVDNCWPDHHWVNLWRNTDPLGGEPLPGMPGNRLVCSGEGHSQYELGFEFMSARTEAVSGVATPAPQQDSDPDIDPCP